MGVSSFSPHRSFHYQLLNADLLHRTLSLKDLYFPCKIEIYNMLIKQKILIWNMRIKHEIWQTDVGL